MKENDIISRLCTTGGLNFVFVHLDLDDEVYGFNEFRQLYQPLDAPSHLATGGTRLKGPGAVIHR